MGLDMNLYVKTNDLSEDSAAAVARLDEDEYDYEIFQATHEDVAYWRKANHIHGWFVNNCADGVDECQRTPVTREQIIELRDLAQKVLDSITTNGGEDVWTSEVIAYDEETVGLLPPVPGFFFGTYDIDAWYVNGTKETVKMLTEVLEQYPDAQEFVYWASW